jgi:methanogenic corrinoid protein MtbC1
MENMTRIVEVIRENYRENKLLAGAAPVTMDYCKSIGADYYSPDPQGAVNYLKSLVS